MKRIFFLILTLAAMGLAQAQRVVSLSWDTAGVNLGKQASVTIGDQLNLIVEIAGVEPMSYAVVFPTKEELSKNNIEVLSQRYDTLNNTASGNAYTVRQINVVTSFEEGEHRLDSIAVQVNEPIWSADVLTLKVMDVPNVDTTKAEIKDIANIMRETYTFWEIFRWVLLAIAVAALAFVAVYVGRKIKKREPIITIPAAPPVAPNKEALDGLESLRVRELWQAGLLKEYHTELTDILRNYLKRQFGIDSFEMTSDQTLEAFQESHPGKAESQDRLRRILRTADMVKFAKAEPQPFEHDMSMKEAKAFVEETSVEVEQPENTEK